MCSPLKTCCCPWFKHFAEHLVGSKFAACTWHRGGYWGVVLLEHSYKHLEITGQINFFAIRVSKTKAMVESLDTFSQTGGGWWRMQLDRDQR
jgi:hypothetical protein